MAESAQFFEDRNLTVGEATAVIEWINSKSIHPDDACLVCGSSHSSVVPAVVGLTGGPGAYPSSRTVLPSVLCVCRNCGFTRLFNAIVMGIEKDPAEDENG